MTLFSRKGFSFSNTHQFDRLIVDYLEDNAFLKRFYAYDDSVAGINECIQRYQNPRLNRQILSDILSRQYSTVDEVSTLVRENIRSLTDSKTFTITAGHQLNIFSGPLYVFYKLISAVNLANNLNKELSPYKFVPVYWMATEDHDMEEISSVNLFGGSFKWNTQWKGKSGKAPLKELLPVIEEIKNASGDSTSANELVELMYSCYDSGDLATATRKWVNHFFGKYGLVIIDGDSTELKKSVRDIFRDELLNQTSSKLVLDSTVELKDKYGLQVNPREINLFYTGKDFRQRIVSEGNHFRILNTEIQFTKDEIMKELDTNPENFSPNVIMRPLYQESILPNVGFTGGPAEIAYWLELKSVFENYKVPMPALFMRSAALILDSQSKSIMEKYSISSQEIFKPVDDIIRTYLEQTDDYSLVKITELLNSEMDKISEDVARIDPTLKATVESERQKMINSLQTLHQKILRGIKKKNEIDVNRIRKAREKLFPGGKLQERVASNLHYLLKWGPGFTDYLMANLNPLEKEFIILEEQAVEA